jgi:hypothetical protein
MICLLPAVQRTGAKAKSRGSDRPIAVTCGPPMPAANTEHFARRMAARSRAHSPASPASRLSRTAPPSCPKPRGRSGRERCARHTTARAAEACCRAFEECPGRAARCILPPWPSVGSVPPQTSPVTICRRAFRRPRAAPPRLCGERRSDKSQHRRYPSLRRSRPSAKGSSGSLSGYL